MKEDEGWSNKEWKCRSGGRLEGKKGKKEEKGEEKETHSHDRVGHMSKK